MIKTKYISALLLLACSSSVFAADSGGIAVGTTRVIYDAASREASISVVNHNDAQYFLIQSWVDDQTGNKNVPFTITPPLFRLNANKENMLRILKTGESLPTDRESVYWVNIKAIPAAPSEGQNVLQLAIKTRVKMFYRPKGLPGKVDESPTKLQWSQRGDELVVKNPTAFSVSFNNLAANGKEIKEANLVLPQGEAHYKMPQGVRATKVSYKCINDYGGLTANIDATVQ